MADIYLTNSLSGKKEKFEPLNPKKVGVYACGPTVYDYASIGTFRTYVSGDVLVRALKFAGYNVDYIMNITDVGHLTGDNEGDADTGVDRIEKSAKKEGKSAWDIAELYTKAFLKDYEKLNLTKPNNFPKATDHIEEQIALVMKLEKGGFTYKISDGIYFDTKVYEEKTGKEYGELSTLDQIKEGARVKENPEKKNARDFALWKFSPKDKKRHMEWESPWGKGFPGWHVECSAMSMKYLGETFDIHFGGEDLRQTHHPNEIAQSEAATGKPFVKYWLHMAFLKIDGKKMGKSLGNFYTLSDLEEKGFDPISLKYLFYTGHYKDPLNFTWESLESASNALKKLKDQLLVLKTSDSRTVLSQEKQEKVDEYRNRFVSAIYDDLDTPTAVAVLWELLKSNVPSGDKYELILTFDEILGLGLSEIKEEVVDVPDKVRQLVDKREEYRKEGNFDKADEVRQEIEDEGFRVKDTEKGPQVIKG